MVEKTTLNKVLKFGFIGLLLFAIDIGLFNLFLNFGSSVLIANILSVSISSIFGYFAHLKVTYAMNSARASARSFTNFLVIGVISIALSHTLLSFAINVIEDETRSQVNTLKVVVTLLIAAIRFILLNKLVYKETNLSGVNVS